MRRLGLLGSAALLAPLALVDRLAERPLLALALGVAAQILWTAAILERRSRPLGAPTLIALAVSLRAFFVAGPELGLSDDVYRYVWEGRVWLAGGDPYLAAPADPALAPLRDSDVFPRVNHPEVPSAYPPLAQALFAAWAGLGLGPRGFRALGALLEGLGFLLLWSRTGRSARVLEAALCPLLVVGSAADAHLDATAAGAIACALVLFARGRSLAGGVLVGVAGLLKPPALIAAPFLVAGGARRRAALGALALVAPAVLVWAHNPERLRGLSTYGRLWEANSATHRPLEALIEAGKQRIARRLEHRGVRESIRHRIYAIDPNRWARVAAAVAALVALAWAARRFGAGRPEPAARAYVLASFFLPAFHPWYALPLVPLVAAARRPPPSALLLLGFAWVGYHPLAVERLTGAWGESGALVAAGWGLVALALGAEGSRPAPRRLAAGRSGG